MNRFLFKKELSNFKKIYHADTNIIISTIKRLIFLLNGKNILPHHSVKIKGIDNISITGTLEIGLGHFGFMHYDDKTLLNVQGKLIIKGNYSIGRGCKIDIGPNGIINIGENGYVSPNTTMIVMHKLLIGSNSVISWNCQFLDEDFHIINYDGKHRILKEIIIGDKVWIGCNVKIYKGVKIANGCVIASDSIVKHRFEEENCLISGNPAKVIKRNINWG